MKLIRHVPVWPNKELVMRLPTEGGALLWRVCRAKLMVAVWTMWARHLMARPPRALEAYRPLRETRRVVDPVARAVQLKPSSEAKAWGGERMGC